MTQFDAGRLSLGISLFLLLILLGLVFFMKSKIDMANLSIANTIQTIEQVRDDDWKVHEQERVIIDRNTMRIDEVRKEAPGVGGREQ